MEGEREGAVWVASYPKSGNTWMRCLLEAYRRGGTLDINDMRITSADGGATIIQGVSPIPLSQLGLRGEMMIRPCALLNLFSRLTKPIWVKTHFANIQPDGLPHCIPPDFTERAVYVVRDPRSVLLSFSRFFHHPLDVAAEGMANKDFTIGGTDTHALTLISSWSNHVSSWVSEKEFPVHVVKYEDMQADAGKELTEVLEFLGTDVDPELVRMAVAASDVGNLKKAEDEDGFRENRRSERGAFFRGDRDYKDELGPKYIKRIEEDHRVVMETLGYLPREAGLKAIS